MAITILEEGVTAPPFTAQDQDGKAVSLKDYFGRKVVLYFYPKDDTPDVPGKLVLLGIISLTLKNSGLIFLASVSITRANIKSLPKNFPCPSALLPILTGTSLKLTEYGGRKSLWDANIWGPAE